jgi:hypothetical protein
MNSEIARIALQFMQRVQLNGSEVQAYQAVVAVLNQYANQEEQQDDGGQADE